MIASLRTRILTAIFIVTFLPSLQAGKPVVLQNSISQLQIDADGSMLLQSTNPKCPIWKVRSDALWRITLAKGSNPFHLTEAIVFTAGKNKPKCAAIEGGVELHYDSIHHNNQTWDIEISLQVKQVDQEFRFLATIENRADGWTVKEFKFPIILEIREKESSHEKLKVLLPYCLGIRLATPKLFGTHRTLKYPSGISAAMQWCAIEGEGAGLYLGCHDVEKKRKVFDMANGGTYYDFALTNEPYCTHGETWKSAPVVVMPFEGTWHVGARRYRKWADTWLKWAPKPSWLTNANSGWFLCILKQQNGDLMFRYDELDTVANIADEWGLDVLGLFGWAEGGHDRSYPDYIPDPKMGGPEVLKKSIKRVQKRGKKVILYANGQLIDMATDFYRDHGKDCMVQMENGEPAIQLNTKFKSTPAPKFAQACLASETWYKRLLKLGIQAQDLGADGLIYDQLAAMWPNYCYDASHGHATPAASWTECRFAMVQRLVKDLRTRDPDFVIMTEGTLDGMLPDLPYFHGCGAGFHFFYPTASEKAFPDMFLYTFPELLGTQRNPNPTMTRNIANFACSYGLRHEIESRYVADVKYIKDHQIPEVSEYSDVNYPPNIHEVRSTPLKPAAKYLRDLIAMEQRFSDFLKDGRFIDTEVFSFHGEKCDANGFLAKDGRLGVVVWNYGSEPQTVELSATDFQLENAYEPGDTVPVDPQTTIPGKTVRFYVWVKTKPSTQPDRNI